MEKLYLNRNKIKAYLVGNGLTQNDLATTFGISRQSLSEKMNKKTHFNESEICFLVKEVGFDIFFD